MSKYNITPIIKNENLLGFLLILIGLIINNN